MDNLKDKQVLFICPKLYDYHQQIINSLEKLGAEVKFYFEHKEGLIFRILKNTSGKLFEIYLNSYYEAIFGQVKHNSYDYVFLIRGEYVPPDFIIRLRAVFPATSFIYYSWDSIKNLNNSINLIPLFDIASTFDFKDAREIPQLQYVPLFCIEEYFGMIKNDCMYDIIFIGVLTKFRYETILSLNRFFKKHNVVFYYYLFIPFLQYLKERFIKRNQFKLKHIKFIRLNEKQVSILIKSTNAVLDLPHPLQSGFTIRTMETLGAGKRLITSNSNIFDYYSDNNHNILLLNENNLEEILPFLRTKKQIVNINPKSEILSLSEWLIKVFTVR